MENKQTKIIILRQGWLASTWCDLQTFVFMCIPFGLNSLYFNNNGWINFTYFSFVVLFMFTRALSNVNSKHVKKLTTTDVNEAVKFLSENS